AQSDGGSYAWSTALHVRKNDVTTNAAKKAPANTPWGDLTAGQKLTYLTSLLVKTKSRWTPHMTDLEHGGTEQPIAGGPTIDALSLAGLFSDIWRQMVADLGRP